MQEKRLPHACGGVSVVLWYQFAMPLSSPRLWGCFYVWMSLRLPVLVFPTPVGVFPHPRSSVSRNHSLPHACGGVSNEELKTLGITVSSPRLWGCFCVILDHRRGRCVFPTPVGVFLTTRKASWRASSLPHACGGVSIPIPHNALILPSSPRLWGCF